MRGRDARQITDAERIQKCQLCETQPQENGQDSTGLYVVVAF